MSHTRARNIKLRSRSSRSQRARQRRQQKQDRENAARAARARGRRKKKETILLNQPQRRRKKDSRNIGAKALDILSSTLLEPTTFIRNPAAAGRLVAERRAEIRRTKDIQLAFDVVGETLTSTAIAGAAVLGAANPAIARSLFLKVLPRTPKSIAATFTAGGLILGSPTLRSFVSSAIEDPTRLGRRGGELFEKALKGEDVGGFKEALKKAGIIGGGIAAVVGVGALAKKLFGGKSGKSLPAVAGGGAPQSVPTSIALPSSPVPSPLVTGQKQEEVITKEEPKLVDKPSAPSVTVNNNIRINNRSSANRRFINNVSMQ